MRNGTSKGLFFQTLVSIILGERLGYRGLSRRFHGRNLKGRRGEGRT